MVGRADELATLARVVTATTQDQGTTVFVAGEGGVGKTRLLQTAIEEAKRLGWNVAFGRAYPVETGVPYAAFADAFGPLLRDLGPGALDTLSRGARAELAVVFPTLDSEGQSTRTGQGDSIEVKARLLYAVSQFLGRLGARRPLLVVVENVQWADAASLELLHFAARHAGGQRVAFFCTYNATQRDANIALKSAERSLVSLHVATTLRLAPLGRSDIEELLRVAFRFEAARAASLADWLFARTRGNAFFVEEMLKWLVRSGALRVRDGRWIHSAAGIPDELPGTVRDAVLARFETLGPDARRVADIAAVVGRRAPYNALLAIAGLPSERVLQALEELRTQRVLAEDLEVGKIVYDFTHPMLGEILYGELARARARNLHGAVAQALERLYGDVAEAHADTLAYHFSRADLEAGPKATGYLAGAGLNALARHADREAIGYLAAALERMDGRTAEPNRSIVVDALARAQQRIGDYDAAKRLWEHARAEAIQANDVGRLATIEWRLGLACFRSGCRDEALARYEAGLAAAEMAGERSVEVSLRIAKAECLQDIGQADAAQREGECALAVAEATADPAVLARAHRMLLLLHTWAGPVDVARHHAGRVITLAEATRDPALAWSAHWALAVLGGLTGQSSEVAYHGTASERLAAELGSPVLAAWTAEVRIEHASAIGDWDVGLAAAEHAIPLARAFGRRTLLPRLLVWTALIRLGRGETTLSKALLDEAWALARTDTTPDVHTAIVTHTGMAAYHLTVRDCERAIEIGEAGIALVDRTGYIAWAVHRLLPIVAEAALWMQDFDRAERLGERLRRDAGRLSHPLGLAWAVACDALITRLKRQDTPRAVALLREAADRLEAVPFALDAARLRRNAAQLLVADGDHDGAAVELRRAHTVFERLGASTELRGTREQLRQLGVRTPPRVSAAGDGVLTGREREIARLVAARRSNKEIGATLGISDRTVSTHLSNIFTKVGVSTRGELADRVRQRGA
jgi:DNA-binding CsgD family transcriptional regulator/tetratricopeptide (TPR) repeat protein